MSNTNSPKPITGHIEMKRGYWHMVFNNGFDVNGKRIRWSKTTELLIKGNKRNAEQILRSQLESLNQDNKSKDRDILVCTLVKKWLCYISSHVTENTFLKYTYAAQHIIPFFQCRSITVQNLLPADISDYYTLKLARMGKEKGLSGNTLISHRTVLIGALQYAKDYLRITDENVALIARAPRKESRLPSFYSDVQILTMFKKIQGEAIAPAAFLAATYGLRRSEVLGLKWSAIDFSKKTITIDHTIIRVGQKDIAKNRTKTKAGLRTLALTKSTERYLKDLYNKQRSSAVKNNEWEEYICKWNDGRLLSAAYVSSRWKRFLEIHELPHIRFHDLRHSAASLLIEQGLSIVEVQLWLGHASLESTSIYLHLYKDSNRKIADTIEAVIKLPI